MGLARLRRRLVVAARGARVRRRSRALFAFISPYLELDAPRRRPALRTTVAQLERRAGVGHVPVRIQDVSGDTSAAERGDEGFGPSRRVVIWDTLLDGRFTPGRGARRDRARARARRSATTSSSRSPGTRSSRSPARASSAASRAAAAAWAEPAAVPLALLDARRARAARAARSRTRSRGTWRPRPTGSRSQTTHDPKDAIAAVRGRSCRRRSATRTRRRGSTCSLEDHPTIDAADRDGARPGVARYATSASAAQLP